MLDFHAVTLKYYSAWLDCDVRDFSGGVRYVCSPKRDIIQTGYSNPFALSLFKTENSVIVSYSGKIQEKISQMGRDLPSVENFDSDLEDYLEKLFDIRIKRNIKFVFNGQKEYSSKNIITLTRNDYKLFQLFRISLEQDGWDGMKEYFEKISDLGYCMARMADGRPVSMTDAPYMPFLPDIVQEIGINTLHDYRNHGYAKEVVSACISKIISDNKCPMWSCDTDNLASERLAYSVGFKKFCDAYSIVI